MASASSSWEPSGAAEHGSVDAAASSSSGPSGAAEHVRVDADAELEAIIQTFNTNAAESEEEQQLFAAAVTLKGARSRETPGQLRKMCPIWKVKRKTENHK